MAAWAIVLVAAIVLGAAAGEVWGSATGLTVSYGLLVVVIAGGLAAQKFLLGRIDPAGELRAAVRQAGNRRPRSR